MPVSPPTIMLTPGEPAGIGPEIALHAAAAVADARVVLVADRTMLRARSAAVGLSGIQLVDFDAGATRPGGCIEVLHVPAPAAAEPGVLNVGNASYVLATLDRAVQACQEGTAAAMVTGPVHKGVINDAGIAFSGHTEYLAERTSGHPVMMLVSPELRVALVTTHLPLCAVPAAITTARVQQTIGIVLHDLRERFGLGDPRVQVCGLNPHAGEGGHLGHEDDDIIRPAIEHWASQGAKVDGPWPADTAFVPGRRQAYDATLAMYHDQGLAVLKALGFGEAVNVTLGLPVVRTSVDHGTALDIAGHGKASDASLLAALALACELAAISKSRVLTDTAPRGR